MLPKKVLELMVNKKRCEKCLCYITKVGFFSDKEFKECSYEGCAKCLFRSRKRYNSMIKRRHNRFIKKEPERRYGIGFDL